MVPTLAFPPVIPFTLQAIRVSDAPTTVPVNCLPQTIAMAAVLGVTVIGKRIPVRVEILGVTVAFAVTVRVPIRVHLAVVVKLCGTAAGWPRASASPPAGRN